MSEDHQHESPIKTWQQLVVIVVLAFVIPITLIGFLVAYVTGGKKIDQQGLAIKPESVAERIRPVAAVNLKDANAPKVFLTGEQVYQQFCKACHEAGVANAPKMGDKTAWGPLIKEGLDTLVADAIKGVRGMPARGGNPDLSDFEMARAVVYMTNAAGAGFKEPAAPAAAAPATAAAKDGAAAAAPAAAAPATGAGLPANVLFATAKASLDAAGSKTVADVAAFLKGNAAAKVSLSGYVDSTGNAKQNAELAKQRAFAVRDALKKAGVAEDRISLKKPEEIKGGDSAQARRVEISLADAAPVAVAAAAPAATTAQAGGGNVGKSLYDTACMACHAAGVANAPKLGDKAAWAPRMAGGKDALYAAVIKGKGAMPPKGTAMTASDADIKAAVDYMLASIK
ncbi:MAG: c-type cytochrome [Burkholderiales bacterium]|nr:c-type cytochrome [Burkholderiales bacterium]